MNERSRKRSARCRPPRTTNASASHRGRRFFWLVLITPLFACSSSAPEILQLDHERVLIAHSGLEEDSPSIAGEYLAVYVDVYDADGREEIAELQLYFDEMDLVWDVPESHWVVRQTRDAYWIGYDRFAMPGLAPFRSGTYRLVVRDLSSSEAQARFELRDPDREGLSFPSYKDGTLTLAAEASFLVCPDGTYRATEGRLDTDDRRLIESGGCVLFSVGEDMTTALLMDPNLL